MLVKLATTNIRLKLYDPILNFFDKIHFSIQYQYSSLTYCIRPIKRTGQGKGWEKNSEVGVLAIFYFTAPLNDCRWKRIIQIWHLGECNINFYCTQKNDIARGACAECNIFFQSAIKNDIDTKPKCHICFIICLLLIQIKYLTKLKNYAPQYQICKVVM